MDTAATAARNPRRRSSRREAGAEEPTTAAAAAAVARLTQEVCVGFGDVGQGTGRGGEPAGGQEKRRCVL